MIIEADKIGKLEKMIEDKFEDFCFKYDAVEDPQEGEDREACLKKMIQLSGEMLGMHKAYVLLFGNHCQPEHTIKGIAEAINEF